MVYTSTMNADDPKITKVLEAIKNNDGFPGPMADDVRRAIVESFMYAIPEVSPQTGLDLQWKLTAAGKKYLRVVYGTRRHREKYRERHEQYRLRVKSSVDAVVPLTIEVLDALKAIRESGDPETNKLDILARIQRSGQHAAKTVKTPGGPLVVFGALAECNNGVWTLTDAGKRVEAGHIRKSECAQFSGKPR